MANKKNDDLISENSGKKKRKKKKKFMTYLMVLLLMIIFAIAGVCGYTYSFLSKLSEGAKKSSVKPLEVGKDDPINILLMGTDIGVPGVDEKYNKTRTDTLLLVNYNPKTEAVNLISIPRDTMIFLNGQRSKINAAHAYGGVPLTIDAVEKLLDIKVNYYGQIDYSGFRQIIDAIGGVDMTISRRMDYDDDSQDLHIHFTKGETVHLDGEKAEEFFRWRENNDGTGLPDGDIGRIENQHLFIQKVIEKFKSASILPKIPSITKLIPTFVETNMSPNDILSYGWDFLKVNQENIKTITLKGDPQYIGGVSYFVYNEAANKDVLNILHTAAAVSSKDNSLDKSKLKIQVLNCTGQSGLASNYADIIKKNGYNNIAISNGEKLSNSKIIVYGTDASYDDLIKNEFGIKNLQRGMKKEDNFDIIVMLGDDYINSN